MIDEIGCNMKYPVFAEFCDGMAFVIIIYGLHYYNVLLADDRRFWSAYKTDELSVCAKEYVYK